MTDISIAENDPTRNPGAPTLWDKITEYEAARPGDAAPTELVVKQFTEKYVPGTRDTGWTGTTITVDQLASAWLTGHHITRAMIVSIQAVAPATDDPETVILIFVLEVPAARAAAIRTEGGQ